MMRLLCIEDQPDIQTILKLTLEASGRFEVSQAENGSDGIATARALVPDVILLDFSLPDMNGLEILQALKADASTASIPVIMLTATTTPDNLDACKAIGAIDAMIKPFNPRTLAEQISSLLSKHQAAG